MRGIVREVEKIPRHPNQYIVYYNSAITGDRGRIDIYAKDEMDAYTQAVTRLEKDKQNMQLLIKCVSTIVALIILTAFGLGQVSRYYYSVNMTTCVAAKKSYVSENEGYSCR
jgi:hypothetical protein